MAMMLRAAHRAWPRAHLLVLQPAARGRARVASAIRPGVLALRLSSTSSRGSSAAAPAAAKPIRRAAGGGDGQRKKKGGMMRKVGFLVFSGIVGFTAYLGAWQTKRYFWKIDVIAAREAKLARPALRIDSVGALLDTDSVVVVGAADAKAGGEEVEDAEAEFTPVTVRGVLLDADTVILGPRSPPKHSAPFNNDHGEKSGYHLLTPLVIRARGGEDVEREEVVLVNRGWVAKSKHQEVLKAIVDSASSSGSSGGGGGGRGGVSNKGKSRAAGDEGEEGQEPEVREVTAVVRSGEARPSSFVPAPDLTKRHFYFLDVPAIMQFVRASGTPETDAAATVQEGRRGEPPGRAVSYITTHVLEQLPPTGNPALHAKPREAHGDFYIVPSTHATYAATWFSLATVGTYLTYLKFIR